MKSVYMYDTTLRDGMQGIEISYSLEDKIQIARKLDEIGIDYIEGGFPLANEKEKEFFDRLKKEKLKNSKLVAFGSTRRPGSKASEDIHIQALLQAETPAVIVVGKSWKEHITHVINTNENENLEMIYDSISYLKSRGREVHFDLEHFFDGYKDTPDYALKVLETATQAGADFLVLCDTNGGVLPHETSRIMAELPLDNLAPIGGHFHNDTGTAVANSIELIRSGGTQVQGTINGWGERCGNANLCVIIPNLLLKMGYDAACKNSLDKLTSLSRFVSDKANIIPEKRQPYVGIAAFSHKAGQHADVIQKKAELMEHIDSSLVGNQRQVLLSELAGKSTIVEKMKKYGTFTKTSQEVQLLIDQLKSREKDGYEYEAAEASFDLIIRKAIGNYTPLFELSNYHLESYKSGETQSKTVGRLFMRLNKHEVMGAAVGVGPVETLDLALRDAVTPNMPEIEKITLTDYRVRVLNPEDATGAKVRVFISFSDHNNHSWDTIGVNENVIEASWEALTDSIEYYYNNFIKKESK